MNKQTRVTFRTTAGIKSSLKEIAKLENRSVSNLIDNILIPIIDEYKRLNRISESESKEQSLRLTGSDMVHKAVMEFIAESTYKMI